MSGKHSAVRFAAAGSISTLFAAALLAGTPGVAPAGAADQAQDRPQERTTAGVNDTGQRNTQQRNQSTQFSRKDMEFLGRAMETNRAEVETARMAKNKAVDREVKDLAQMIESDHERLNQRLKAMGIADNKADTQQARAGKADKAAEHHHAMQDLQRASGEEFDRRFLAHMAEQHRNTIEEFRAVANDTTYSQQVRDLARETLPVLERHENRALGLREELASR